MKRSESDADNKIRIDMPLENVQVVRLYDLYRGEFLAFARKYFSLCADDAIDIYQESFLALYENIHSGRLEHLSVSLKTYLFRIARNKMLNRYRNDTGKTLQLPDDVVEENSDWVCRQQIVFNMVQEMEEPCNTVLTLYYWERKSMENIAGALNYASAQVAKNRKSACMRKLKEVLTKKFTAEGFM